MKYVLIIIALVLIIFLFIWLSSYWSDVREQKMQDNVRVMIRYDNKNCSDINYPILVSIYNWTKKSTSKVRFDLEIHKKWYSSNLVSGIPSYSTDKIIDPWEQNISCWSVPQLDDYITPESELIYEVNYKDITFIN